MMTGLNIDQGFDGDARIDYAQEFKNNQKFKSI
jgi:hypothetical protein